jgi:hypothetical protein
MTTPQTVRRFAPPDRRTPIKVGVRACPLGRGCYCCPVYTSKFRGALNEKCDRDHPAADRLCSPPYPDRPPACPERQTLPQNPHPAVGGWRPPPIECCIECGRVTGRRWTRPTDGAVLAWCAGLLPQPPTAEPAPSGRSDRCDDSLASPT